MPDPVIHLSLGIVLSVIGLVAAFLAAVIGSWYALNKKLDQVDSKMDVQGGAMEELKKLKQGDHESIELFQQQVRTEHTISRESIMKQQSLCEGHHLKLNQVCSEIRAQNEGQKYMQSLFEDMKRLQLSTASAINGVTNVLTKLEAVIEQSLKERG